MNSQCTIIVNNPGMANRRFIYCLVLALCTISTSADVFVSIDCGSSGSYKDENGIVWTGDANFTRNGESRSVQPSNSVSHVTDTLRVFTTQKKNCYDIDSVKRRRVLVRATFHYGNYDNKSSPPTFDLLFDGNQWDTIRTSSVGPVWREVIYSMKGDRISVCVAQTNPGEFPFVSAVEVRALEAYKYDKMDNNYPLLLRKRVAFGSNATIRYQEDPYDRIWSPEPLNKGYIRMSSDAVFGEALIWKDSPPPAVLKHAISAPPPNRTSLLMFGLPNILLPMGFPSNEIPVYINWYFSEVTQLQPNQTRSFILFRNNDSFSTPILPPYENCTELYISNHTVSSDVVFSLVPTNNSTLPPIINALEVFLIGDELSNGTHAKDVEGLDSVKEAFELLEGWSGDPCFPAPYAWDWIVCTPPRVTALLLGSLGLSGLIPDFSSMNALQTIDLHNNSLIGPIPDFLGNFPNLKILNLSNNQLNGSIPASLSTKKGLTLVVSGNPELCTSSTSCPVQSASSSISNKNNILFSTIFSSIIILHLMIR